MCLADNNPCCHVSSSLSSAECVCVYVFVRTLVHGQEVSSDGAKRSSANGRGSQCDLEEAA